MRFPTLIVIAALMLPLSNLSADEVSHKAAAEGLLNSMNMEKLLTESVDQMLVVQIQQNPQLAEVQPQMRDFLIKHMSWASLKDDMISIYTAEFTEDELKELTAFYQTPVGKKAIEKMPAMMAKGAELGQKRVQDNLPELQAAIQAALQKK